MVNPYLDWIWSKYDTSHQQDMLSLRETCSALVKYSLLPSDIVLSGGGYVLRHDLATTLSHVIYAMDHLLDMSAKHLGLVNIPAIGHTKLDLLSGTGVQRVIATQNQVVTNWVFILNSIAAAKHQLKALCSGDFTHSSLDSWPSQVGPLANGLPLDLRRKLPKDLVNGLDIEFEGPAKSISMLPSNATKTPLPLACAVTSSSSNNSSSSFSDAAFEVLIRDWNTYMRLDFNEIAAIYVINTGAGRYMLDSELLFSVNDTIKQVQLLLAERVSESTSGFQVDPQRHLKRMLQSSSDLESLSAAWNELRTRLRQAFDGYKQYQQGYQERPLIRRTNRSSTVDVREDRAHSPHFPSFSSLSPAPCSELSERTVELGGQNMHQHIDGDAASQLTLDLLNTTSPSHCTFPLSPTPSRIVDRVKRYITRDGGRMDVHARAQQSHEPCVDAGGRRHDSRMSAQSSSQRSAADAGRLKDTSAVSADVIANVQDNDCTHTQRIFSAHRLATPARERSPPPLRHVVEHRMPRTDKTTSMVDFGGLQGTAHQKCTSSDKETRTMDEMAGFKRVKRRTTATAPDLTGHRVERNSCAELGRVSGVDVNQAKLQENVHSSAKSMPSRKEPLLTEEIATSFLTLALPQVVDDADELTSESPPPSSANASSVEVGGLQTATSEIGSLVLEANTEKGLRLLDKSGQLRPSPTERRADVPSTPTTELVCSSPPSASTPGSPSLAADSVAAFRALDPDVDSSVNQLLT
ncbi:hypothetical protein R3P38DRAFT_2867080, partial [Favolaschia claudopus]